MADCILEADLAAMIGSITDMVLTRPSAQTMLTLATGWVLCRARHTTTGLIVAARAVGKKHFSSYHSLFSRAAWRAEDLWLAVLRLVVGELCPVGELILVGDDTVVGKCGRKIAGAGNWRNACGSTRQQYRFLWGLNLVILGVAVDFCGKTFCLPVGMRIYRKQADCERLGRPYRTRSQLMRQMAQTVLDTFPGRSVVLLVDGQYATKELLRDLPEGVIVITRLRCDAALWKPAPARRKGTKGRTRKRGARLPTPEAMARDGRRRWTTTAAQRQVKTLVALWYRASGTHRCRIVIVEQDNPREPYGYFLCTEQDWDADSVLSTYWRRWSIELTIRDAKQHAGLGQLQCRSEKAVQRQHAFTLAMISVVKVWYMRHGHTSDRGAMHPWYLHKAGPTFADMLAHARRQSLGASFLCNCARAPDFAQNAEDLLSFLEAAA